MYAWEVGKSFPKETVPELSVWLSVKETGIRKERAWIGWYSADVPLRQPFLFPNIEIALCQLAKCHCLKPHNFPRPCHPCFAPGHPHDPKTKGLPSGASGAFQDSAWALCQISIGSNWYARVTQLLDILNIIPGRVVCIRQKQHHEEGVTHAENCQVCGLAEIEVKEGGGGDWRWYKIQILSYQP